jgi:RNA polymerase sigma-70 factor (ECF subfamily)
MNSAGPANPEAILPEDGLKPGAGKRDIRPHLWVDDHGDYLYAYAFAQVRDRIIAQDLVQETLLTALKSLDAFEGRSSEKTWLTGILRNKIGDHIRSKYRGMNRLTEAGDPTDALFDETGHWKIPPAQWNTTPLDELENREFHAMLEGCLSKLKEPHRDLFVLRAQHEADTDECCKTFGLSPTNMGVILYRIRQQLRRCLEIHWLGPKGRET